MHKLILGLLLIVLSLTLTGCQAIKGAATGAGVAIAGVGIGISSFGKGLADDAYGVWEKIDKADKWFQERYW